VGGFFFMAFWEIQIVFFHQFPDHEVPLKKDTFQHDEVHAEKLGWVPTLL
jgi:hypothetical protein